MCGFVFVVERGRPVGAERLRAAADSIRHRGPDARGLDIFTTAYDTPSGSVDLSVGVACNRLSIIDLDARSDQPLRKRGRTLAYNGEIYNFKPLRAGLQDAHVPFASNGDAEVLLELLAARGLAGLGEANGMWAFCLLDEVAGRLTAARDRYGKKPLYYFADDQTICFASAIAPIATYLGRRLAMDIAALDTYLAHGWLFPGVTSATHFIDIRQVLPGAYVNIDLAAWSLAAGAYLDMAGIVAGEEPRPEALPELLRAAVVDRLVSDRKVGLLLSGGVDSSLILSILASTGHRDQVHCFTGDAGKSEDAAYARRCVAALGIQAHSIALDYEPSGMERFLRVCRHQEKPFPLIGNVLAMPEMYEAIGAHDVRVVLDGTGGDEVFGGYWDRYYRFAAAEAATGGDADWLAAVAAPAPRTRATGLGEAGLASFCRPEVLAARPSDPLASLQAPFDQALLMDATRGRMQEWLWQNDRNAMLASVENRSPLLDVRLAAFLRTGYRRKFVGRWNKHELRSAFASFTPLPTQWRAEKQGFRWVYGRFFRRNRPQVLELIAASQILRERVKVDALLDAACRSDDVLCGEITQRSLCVAGLEQAMAITA